jgi:hypothetical protein
VKKEEEGEEEKANGDGCVVCCSSDVCKPA